MALGVPAVLPNAGGADAQPKPVVWVRPNSNVQGVAGLITSSIDEDERVTLRAIGAGAVNQAIKAAIQARQQLSVRGEDLIVKPGFTTVVGNDGNEVTAIVLHCLLL
jgi:stage V sporulation protein S